MHEDVFGKLNTISKPSSDEILACMESNGIMNIDNARELTHEMNLEKIIMPKQPYHIWQGANGRWNCYVPDETNPEGRRRLSSKSKRKLLEKLVKYAPEQYESLTGCITLRDLYPEWLQDKAEWVEENTIPRIDLDWRTYYLNDPIIDIPLESISKSYLEKWLLRLIRDNDMSKTKFYNVSSILRQMYEFAFNEQYIEENTMLRVSTKKLRKWFKPVLKKNDDLQVYTDDEIYMLKTLILEKMNTPGKRVYALAPLAILFQFYTGLRVGEICALRYSDIKPDGKAHIQNILVRDTGQLKARTKGAIGYRDIILSKSALEIINQTTAYKGNSEGFIFSMNEKPLAERVINEYLKRYCSELDIPYRSSHKLRKTALSSMVASGMSIAAVCEYAGQTKETTLLNHYLFDRNSEIDRQKQIDKALSYQ